MIRAGTHLALLTVAGLASGCLSVAYERTNRFEPPRPGSVDSLAEGESGLGACLGALGAPLWVGEWPGRDGRGAVLAYGWFEEGEWELEASVPLGDASGSFSFTDVDSRMRGVLLFFEEDWTLARVRVGFLQDLAFGQPLTRPQPLPEDV